MPTLARFMLAYPEIELDMDFGDRVVDVIDNGYDILVSTEAVSDLRLMSRSLGAYQLKLVGSPAYFARAAIPSTLKHLAGHACLHRKNPGTGRLQHWPLAAADDIALPTTAIASTIDALVSLAEHGAGIACVPDFSVRQQIEDGVSFERASRRIRTHGIAPRGLAAQPIPAAQAQSVHRFPRLKSASQNISMQQAGESRHIVCAE